MDIPDSADSYGLGLGFGLRAAKLKLFLKPFCSA
jgi:hypothetical protein